MKKILLQLATFGLCTALCIPGAAAARVNEDMIQVGLAYGEGALTAANLQNNTGFGEGFRFGYFDEDLAFEELGYTDEAVTAITILRTSEIYLSGDKYTTEEPDGRYETIGCYHVVLDEFDEYEEASELAQEYEDGFVAWISGTYQVRQGAYSTKEEAEEAAWELDGIDVKGTSAYAVNVVETGSTDILFQFDGSTELELGVMPDVTGEEDVRTWFKGYRYRGGFRYQRIGGGDITVVNIVDMETYVKGVIPYEMNNAWPMEALKAQAVCARSYGYNNMMERAHTGGNFDICTTEHCQVYRGVGSGNEGYQANERTDEAVEETAGMYALYDGKPIWAYYSSSHGGGSERIDRVWVSNFSKFPYISGVVDPYEQLVAHLNSYSYWTKTCTSSELLQRLQEKGYGIGTSIESLDLTYSEFGNVVEVRVNFTNGKSNSFTPKASVFGVRALFGGLSSLHFTINGQGAETGVENEVPVVNGSAGGVVVNEDEKLDLESRLYVLTGRGRTARIDPEVIHVITGDGDVEQLDIEKAESGPVVTPPTQRVVTITGKTYKIEGSGNGHQLGMSQYGAYAMAEEGFDYDEIIEFYYPGVEVDDYRFEEE